MLLVLVALALSVFPMGLSKDSKEELWCQDAAYWKRGGREAHREDGPSCGVCEDLFDHCQNKPVLGGMPAWAELDGTSSARAHVWERCVSVRSMPKARGEKQNPRELCLRGLNETNGVRWGHERWSEYQERCGLYYDRRDGDLLTAVLRSYRGKPKWMRDMLMGWPFLGLSVVAADSISLLIFSRISAEVGFNPFYDHISCILADFLSLIFGAVRLYAYGALEIGLFACDKMNMIDLGHKATALVVGSIMANQILILLFTLVGVRALTNKEITSYSPSFKKTAVINGMAYVISFSAARYWTWPRYFNYEGECAFFFGHPRIKLLRGAETLYTLKDLQVARNSRFCYSAMTKEWGQPMMNLQAAVTLLLVISSFGLLLAYGARRREEVIEGNEEGAQAPSDLGATGAIIAEAGLAAIHTSMIFLLYRVDSPFLQIASYIVGSVQVVSHLLFFSVLSPHYRKHFMRILYCRGPEGEKELPYLSTETTEKDRY